MIYNKVCYSFLYISAMVLEKAKTLLVEGADNMVTSIIFRLFIICLILNRITKTVQALQ